MIMRKRFFFSHDYPRFSKCSTLKYKERNKLMITGKGTLPCFVIILCEAKQVTTKNFTEIVNQEDLKRHNNEMHTSNKSKELTAKDRKRKCCKYTQYL